MMTAAQLARIADIYRQWKVGDAVQSMHLRGYDKPATRIVAFEGERAILADGSTCRAGWLRSPEKGVR